MEEETIIKDLNKMSLSKQTIRILVAGGSFGGKSFFNHFLSKLNQTGTSSITKTKFEITLVDPREGFINILAIPRSVFDTPFAKQTYSNDYDIPFGTDNDLYRLNFIHGKLTNLTPKEADITLVKGSELTDEKITLPFDYMINATGRSRSWPFDPNGYTKQSFVDEMTKSRETITKAKTISIIGAGAVGIETAGELKQLFPEKTIVLVHPYDKLPPENLEDEFKTKIAEHLLEIGIDLRLNTRFDHEVDDGFVTTDGSFIKSDLILWCGSKHNRVSYLENEHFQYCLDPKTHEVSVNNKLQLIRDYTLDKDPFKTATEPEVLYDNVFAIGDIMKLPVMKVAGGAYRSAMVVATNIYNKYLRLELGNNKSDIPSTSDADADVTADATSNKEDQFEDLTIEPWPRGMMMSVGDDFTIEVKDGNTVVNSVLAKSIYKDFTNAYISMAYKVKFDDVEPWTPPPNL